jgi:hypothetical protein
MVKVIYPIRSSWIGEVVKAMIDHVNVALCLAIALVVVSGGHLNLNLKVLHKLLPEVQDELTISVRDNREGVSMKSAYLVQKDLSSLLSLNIL